VPSPTAKLERLLNLTAALLETGKPLTGAQIANRVAGYPAGKSAFHRQFERDKDDLREMGIPITTLEIVEGELPEIGYRIRKADYYLQDPGLEPDELAALHLAASAVRLDGIEGTGAMWKLGGVPHTTKERNAIDRRHGGLAAIPAGDAVVTAFGAVAERRSLSFRYRGADRTVDPYRLDFQRGRWYLTGFDHLRDDERVFRLDRVEGAVKAGAPRSFERPTTSVPGTRLEPWQLGEGEPVRARVLIDAGQAPIAVAVVGADAVVETRGDGGVVVELPVTNTDGFRSFVLSFLEHAEVLGPEALRADMVAWLDAMSATAS
jgi:proteasome accessory factor B